jgi:hypothetical protein
MTKIRKTRTGAFTELWGFPTGSICGSHKLGDVGPAREGAGFEASRGMKSGLEFRTFDTRKAAEDWISQAGMWGPLQQIDSLKST